MKHSLSISRPPVFCIKIVAVIIAECMFMFGTGANMSVSTLTSVCVCVCFRDGTKLRCLFFPQHIISAYGSPFGFTAACHNVAVKALLISNTMENNELFLQFLAAGQERLAEVREAALPR